MTRLESASGQTCGNATNAAQNWTRETTPTLPGLTCCAWTVQRRKPKAQAQQDTVETIQTRFHAMEQRGLTRRDIDALYDLLQDVVGDEERAIEDNLADMRVVLDEWGKGMWLECWIECDVPPGHGAFTSSYSCRTAAMCVTSVWTIGGYDMEETRESFVIDSDEKGGLGGSEDQGAYDGRRAMGSVLQGTGTKIKTSAQQSIEYLSVGLYSYFATVPHRETKTQGKVQAAQRGIGTDEGKGGL